MTRKTPVNVAASVRARLLTVSKQRREDFTLTLVNYASERFLYRLSQSTQRDRFILKGATLVRAIRATFHRRGTGFPDGEPVALTDRFVQDRIARANWKAFTSRNQGIQFGSLELLVSELREFLLEPLQRARTGEDFTMRWKPGGPWA